MHKKIKVQLQKFIDSECASYLGKLGYKQNGNYFYKTNTELQYSLDFVIEKISKQKINFYVKAGINSKPFDKVINRKVEKLPMGYDNISNEIIFNFGIDVKEYTYNQKELLTKVAAVVNKIEKKFAKVTNTSELVNYCVQHNYLVHHEDLFTYLVKTKDEEKLEIYLKQVKKRLYQIADRAYNVYVEKTEQLKQQLK